MNKATEHDANEEVPEEQQDESYVLEKPDMFVATPVDPLFIILPLLTGARLEAT